MDPAMTELSFHVRGAEVVPFSASPQLALHLDITCATPDQRIESILLRCAVRIQAGARAYDSHERHRLRDLFGEADVWARSSKSLLWTHVSSFVSGFTNLTTVELLLPCSYDLATAAAKYLHGVSTGDVPITLQFSGTVFYATALGLTVTQIPWDREAEFRLPIALWRAVIDQHFPNSAVLSLRRDLFDSLDRYRAEHGLPSWDHALEALLAAQRPEPGDRP
jgi:Family of unknown function (DUF6084)